MTRLLSARTVSWGLLLGGFIAAGCSSAPETTHTGFLSDYSKLKEVDKERMRYVSPTLTQYTSFIVDPIQISAQTDLKPEDRAEISTYFHDSLVKVLKERGYQITDAPHANTARIRVAITGVKDGVWWMKIHPGSSLAGAGRGGAAMEGEVIDATTGQQVAAVVQAGKGSQFTAFNYSTVSDIKSTIDQWAKTAGDRLDEMRGTSKKG